MPSTEPPRHTQVEHAPRGGSTTVAALFVDGRGVYANLPGVDAWPVERDARAYAGPHPVVAHPPCERWGAWAEVNPNPKARRRQVGDDGGCFEAALKAVRAWGGVIEHPRGSRVWGHFGLPRPGKVGWGEQDGFGGRSCSVYQGNYGHPNPKPTWLYAVLPSFPGIDWSKPPTKQHLSTMATYRSKEERQAACARGEKLPRRPVYRERIKTPEPFRDLLLTMARTVRPVGDEVDKP